MKKIILLSIVTLLSVSSFARKKAKVEEPVCNGRVITFETTMGTIKVRLYDSVKQHADNFYKLASEKFYDSTLFHRVIKSFMIQGGDPNSKNAAPGVQLGNGDIGYRVPAEFMTAQYIHKKGALAAARDGNPEKASSACQFYIVQGKVQSENDLMAMEQRKNIKYTAEQKAIYTTIGGTPFLDNDYTVFGEVSEGLDIVEKIAQTQTAPGDRPVVDVRILKSSVCPLPKVAEPEGKKKKKKKKNE